MIRDEKFKLIGIPLVGALIIYFGGYYGLEHLRHRRGPWQVEFTITNGMPELVINQPFLEITNVTLRLDGEPLPAGLTNSTVYFADPLDTPFPTPEGRVIFEDLTFLPGTVTFDLDGHGVELLPRTLIVNGREHAWKSGDVITLEPGEKTHPITPEEYKKRLQVLKEPH